MDLGLGSVSTYRLNTEHQSLKKCDGIAASHPVLKAKLPVGDILEKTLTMSQGVHAPFRLKMEHKFASQIGRLGCLPSSNFQRDVLSGRDEEIGFSDLCSQDREWMTAPHPLSSAQKF